jgi:hypothetical protein
MRIVGFLLVAATVLAAGCTATTSPDEECVVQGGMCFIASDPGGCGTPIGSGLCTSGYTCCAMINAYNVRDGGVFSDAGPPPDLFDTGAGDAASDATHDAASEATHDAASEATQDAASEAAHDATTLDAAKDSSAQ